LASRTEAREANSTTAFSAIFWATIIAITAPSDPLSLSALYISLFERDLRANAFAFVARENRFPLFRITL
jgi:hypothetical protein